VLTIGELSSRTGVAPSALRFYESVGLIAAHRTDGNQRRYERSTLRRVAFVQAGKAAGIPLAEIQAALATLPAGRRPTRRGDGRPGGTGSGSRAAGATTSTGGSRRWPACATD
jgi:MerR family redox-sensitive transcriptional activator SoxR